jgi:hypothetical protein
VSHCHITLHDEGRAGAAARLEGMKHAFTVEVESTFDPAFIEAVKRIPWTDREWDKEGRRWWFTGRQLEAVKELALAHYTEVLLVAGAVTTNVRTGESYAQESLF